ncbi:MAG TPA: alpha-L-rhamnosidase C-terminal domain-containing protein [Gaiellaceae bacterium]|nr:alpha-L-rhamnosidase C-terminal domain-containing protein [Gaiellaceae bacterium]
MLALFCANSASARAAGSFSSSDPLLNTIWQVSVKTARDVVLPGPFTTDALGRSCVVDLPKIISDGVSRDRCPVSGDEAASGLTLEISTPADLPVVRSMIQFFAKYQLKDGAIPASPDLGNNLPTSTGEDGPGVLFDYNAWWVMGLYDYVLYSGDTAFARQMWPNLVRMMDGWFVAKSQPNGLVVNASLLTDYSYFPSRQPLVAFFNAQYALALEDASAIAGWIAQPGAMKRWLAREAGLVKPFNHTFWDGAVGAYDDSPTGPVVHPQDGNAFAILSGLATPAQARSALAYLGKVNYRSYGQTIADTDAWDNATMNGVAASQVVYPIISYFEVLARYETGLPDSALDMIRRTWGYMVANGPHQGMWELIGPYGGGPPLAWPSWEHGWSSVAAPALTNEVLGVQPTSPGFKTFTVMPHPSDLKWASGTVPTPHGDITVSWKIVGGTLKVSVHAPPGETLTSSIK